MDKTGNRVEQLRNEIQTLRDQLEKKEKELFLLEYEEKLDNASLLPAEISRYSRQMLVPQIGVCGQKSLKESKVLIVGIGGLGCPAALYLAAAGVGEITLIDDDNVDLTNLHRQILHTQNDIGVPKVVSASQKLTRVNSNIKIIPLSVHADSKTFAKVLSENKYDVVIDGSDNVATRYLLNDACVINKTPLVSGSALQMEGQLTVYNYDNGPCYRCLFPKPPPPETVTSCGDGGVLGAVPGVIGVLEALEAVKIIVGSSGVLSGRLLAFDGTETVFRNFKLRNKNVNCDVCGENPTITHLIDYEQFCGAKSTDKVTNINILDAQENIGILDMPTNLKENELLIDVRPKIEFEMCHLPNSLNFPFTNLVKNQNVDELTTILSNSKVHSALTVYVICRRGNDSQRAVHKLKEQFVGTPVKFFNVKGGLHAYSKYVNASFPIY